jgi:hypothetical protein
MNGEIMIKDKYILNFTDENRNISHVFTIEEGSHHYEIHREFLTFLSAVYGYDLHTEYTD